MNSSGRTGRICSWSDFDLCVCFFLNWLHKFQKWMKVPSFPNTQDMMYHISNGFRDFPYTKIILIYNIRIYIYTDIVYFMLPYIFYHIITFSSLGINREASSIWISRFSRRWRLWDVLGTQTCHHSWVERPLKNDGKGRFKFHFGALPMFRGEPFNFRGVIIGK